MAKKLTGYAMVFPPEDKMGFAVPVAPGHSLKLLNIYAYRFITINTSTPASNDR